MRNVSERNNPSLSERFYEFRAVRFSVSILAGLALAACSGSQTSGDTQQLPIHSNTLAAAEPVPTPMPVTREFDKETGARIDAIIVNLCKERRQIIQRMDSERLSTELYGAYVKYKQQYDHVVAGMGLPDFYFQWAAEKACGDTFPPRG